MKGPALTMEDGATIHCGITEVQPDLFRAHCYAHLDNGSHIETEAPDYEMCDSREAGIAWIERSAARRGFARYRLEVRKGKT